MRERTPASSNPVVGSNQQVGGSRDMAQERHFGNRLRESRVAAGLSQSELEELSGIPKARLSRYENGHVEPSIQTLARLSKALNVSEASLLGDERAAMEEFFNVLSVRGVAISSKDQAQRLGQAFADMVKALGGVDAVVAGDGEPAMAITP
jgi:transcriptional regulator with XRE-family HTH domain